MRRAMDKNRKNKEDWNQTNKPDWKLRLAVTTSVVLAGLLLWNNRSGSKEIKTYGLAAPPSAQTPPPIFPSAETFTSAQTQLPPAEQGDILFENRRFEESIVYYRKALTENPKDADTLNDLGLALHYTGKTQDGVAALKKAVKADPKYQLSWLSLGYVLSVLKRFEEANEALKNCVALGADTPQGVEAKKMLFRNLGETVAP